MYINIKFKSSKELMIDQRSGRVKYDIFRWSFSCRYISEVSNGTAPRSVQVMKSIRGSSQNRATLEQPRPKIVSLVTCEQRPGSDSDSVAVSLVDFLLRNIESETPVLITIYVHWLSYADSSLLQLPPSKVCTAASSRYTQRPGSGNG